MDSLAANLHHEKSSDLAVFLSDLAFSLVHFNQVPVASLANLCGISQSFDVSKDRTW